ncbi:hypothetical protein XANCAGTX0491_009804 [Xanthoria calcicola]
MRISLFYVAGALLSLVAAQQPLGPNPFTLPPGFMINAGQQTTITWTPTAGDTVSIRLRAGASSNLEEGTVVASNVPNNGRTSITLPADTTRNSDYALQIVADSGEVNYSAHFVVESKNTVKPVSSSPSSAATSSAASTSSEDSSSTTAASSMTTTTGASTRTSMSTRTGSSSMTRSTGSASASSGQSSATGESATGAEGAATTTVPSSGAVSLTAGGLLMVVMAGLVAAW